jgi:hypothetical protein
VTARISLLLLTMAVSSASRTVLAAMNLPERSER